MWLGKGLLGESRYKICIVTEAASWLGAGLGVQGARGAQQERGHDAGACGCLRGAQQARGHDAGACGARSRRAGRTRACSGRVGGRRRCARGAARLGRAGARGAQADARLGARGARQQARHGRAGRVAWALGERLGRAGWPRLCTWCTRPIFCPVRLGIFLKSNFWTLFVNQVHEHYSSQKFS